MLSKRAVALALACLLAFGACSGDDDTPIAAASPSAEPTPPAPQCPLTGLDAPADADLDRPAVAVKIENNQDAYPLSGLEDAELVYEEQVEGGQTRFMAIFHCTDTKKAGPVRSSRAVDPAIMTPTTRILAAAGGNLIVREILEDGNVIIVDEDSADTAMRRVDRPGISSEHTLYGNTAKLRKIGQKEYKKPPPDDLFSFGDLPAGGKKVKKITVEFSSATTIEWKWSKGEWRRSELGEQFIAESGEHIATDNLIIEMHTVNNSTTIVDVAGNPSIEIADVTGKGKAILFRDGRAFIGQWVRKSRKKRVVYRTKGGKEMTLKAGTTWVELLPNDKGQVKGSVRFGK
ncbi:MAG: hypothetical protein QOH26_1749 [Actinomycetota bacterium]|nr:hypothetical protein [Actinomycetota bacterium]